MFRQLRHRQTKGAANSRVGANITAPHLDSTPQRMHIVEQHTSPELAVPKAARVLQQLSGVPTFEDAYATRHPFGAYNVSLTSIARRLLAVVEALDQVQRQAQLLVVAKSLQDEPLLEAMDHLLDALMEHMGVCNGILRAFFAPADDKKFKKSLSAFKASVEPYRKHIGTIDNYIKHNQGKLRSIHFRWPTGISCGYFVEGPLASGVLGPVAVVHPGENTAFSFSRDLAYHLCSVFAVGAQLAHALHCIDRRLVVQPPLTTVEVRDSDWSKAIRLTAALPAIYFPDEVSKPIPRIQVSASKVLIEYPALRFKVSGPPLGSQISLTFGGDGVTKSFKMPYFHEGA